MASQWIRALFVLARFVRYEGQGGDRSMYIGGGAILVILIILLLIWIF